MMEWLFNQSSQLLGLLAFIGVVAALYRWERATRRDFLLAFILCMAGSSLRESVVYFWGNGQWGDVPLVLSTAARCLQITGAVLFIRYATRDAWTWWGLAPCLLSVFLVVMVV